VAAGALGLGHALQRSNGTFEVGALGWLSFAFAACALGVLAAPRGEGPREARVREALPGLLTLGVLVQALVHLRAVPVHYLERVGPDGLVPFQDAVAVAALAVLLPLLLPRSRLAQRLAPPLLLAAFTAAGLWALSASPRPFIDVHVFQQDAARALLRGRNPYAITFPDIYGESPFYGEGVSVGGRLLFGFPYPPLSLLLALPGVLARGDHRYAQLAALALAGALLAYARPGSRAALPAAGLLLLSPRVFFTLEQGWTEPFLLLLLAAAVFAACRLPAPSSAAGPPRGAVLLGALLGGFWALKQYAPLTAPLALLLLPGPWRAPGVRRWAVRALGAAAAVGLALTLPFVLWGPRAFWHSVVALHVRQPFREDALSYLAAGAAATGERLPGALGFLAVALLGALALWCAPRTPSGFAGALALVLLGFFAFNKQAFCNYYFLVVGALCAALAALPAPAAPGEEAAGGVAPQGP
jgi:hypothetical protein